ncbi:MAG: hypothetical protein MI974_19305 [Chitinophagales bacterium]|nr:hypothetical protein [Chitinophagales bacterium]
MLSIFRTNQLFASILLAFYIIIVRVSAFFVVDFPEPYGYGVLSDWVYQWIGSDTTIALITAMVLLLIQAFYINFLISEHRLADEISLFPGLFYILISSALPEFNYLSPTLMANTFFIIAFGEVLATYKKVQAADRIYNTGFWIGVASLFYPSYIVLLIFVFAGLSLLRAFKFKERLMVTSGILTPYIILGAYYFWIKQWDVFVLSLTEGFGFLSFVKTPPIPLYRGLGIFLILILVVNFSYRNYQFKQKMDVQRKINILFWGLFATVFSLFIQVDITISHLAITAFPIGVMLSLNFIKMPARMAEVIHLLMLVGLLAMHFSAWLFPS